MIVYRRICLFLIFLISGILLLASCSKPKPELSSDKYLTGFVLTIPGNPGVLEQTNIGQDTVTITTVSGVTLSNITPTISFVGKSISPSASTSQDFSKPVRYTITAQNGSTKTYVVVVRFFSSKKSITSFVFRAADNPGVLSKDVAATIKDDSITALVPPGTDLSNLVPDITYNSKTITPATKAAQNFNGTITYTLTAVDQSTATYKVFTGQPGTIYFGDGRPGYIYAINAVNGHIKWKYLTGGGVVATPTIYKNMLIDGSADKYVYAIDTTRGKLVWKVQLDDQVGGLPCVANDMVYISAQNFYALDARTGKKIWGIDNLHGHLSVTVSGGIAYVADGGTLSESVRAYNALTGQLIAPYGVSAGYCNRRLQTASYIFKILTALFQI